MKKHSIISAYLFSFICLFASCNQKDSTKTTVSTETPANESVNETVNESDSESDSDSVKESNNETVAENKSEAGDSKPTLGTNSKKDNVPLRLIIDNLKTSDGEIEVGVYTPKNNFPDEDDKFKKYRFKAKKGKIDEMITDIPYGVLAMAIYHDENNNGKIDKNAIGIPKEPYAFSNNFKPTVKAPNFDNCKFNYNKKSSTVKISMLK